MGHSCKGDCLSGGKYATSSCIGRANEKQLKNHKQIVKKCLPCGVRFYNLDKDEIHCPCCGYQLRMRKSNVYYKKIKNRKNDNKQYKQVITQEGYKILVAIPFEEVIT